MNTNRIRRANLAGRVHQRVGERAIRRKQQQPGRGDVETANGDPARALQPWQGVKHELAAFRILSRRNFVAGLVVDDIAMRLLNSPQRQRSPVQRYALRPSMCHRVRPASIDRQAAFPNPAFDFASRAVTGGREHFLNALSQPGPAVL